MKIKNKQASLFLLNRRPVEVLLQLSENPGFTQMEIAENIDAHTTQVGQILKKLKKMGLVVSKRRHTTIYFAISERGQRLVYHLEPIYKLLNEKGQLRGIQDWDFPIPEQGVN